MRPEAISVMPSGLPVCPRSLLPTISAHPASSQNYRRRPLPSLKALHLSSTFKPRRVFECSAAVPRPECSAAVPRPRRAEGIGFLFLDRSRALWGFYLLCCPCPRIPSYPWLHLAAGVLLVAGSLFVDHCDPPETDLHFWISLLSINHPFLHSELKGSVSGRPRHWACGNNGELVEVLTLLTPLMSCAEPVFGMLLSSLFLLGGKWFRFAGTSVSPSNHRGCALAAATDPNFNKSGFTTAMIASFTFTSLDILLKRGKEKEKGKDGS